MNKTEWLRSWLRLGTFSEKFMYAAIALAILWFSFRKVPKHPATAWHDPVAGEAIHHFVSLMKPILLYGAIGCSVIFIVLAWIEGSMRRAQALRYSDREEVPPSSEKKNPEMIELSKTAYSTKKNKVAKDIVQKPKPESDLLTCPHCGSKYRVAEYQASAPTWLCSSCKNSLPKKLQ